MKRKYGNGGDPDDRRATDSHNLPVADPTKLTQEAVDRAINNYREVVTEQFGNVETRLHGMDRATDLLANELLKITANLREQRQHIQDGFDQTIQGIRESYVLQIQNVANVTNEKFAAIDTQFRERDTRTDQTDKERKISLDAALAAAKEAVKEQNTASALAIGKSEAGIKEKIDALVLLMTTSNKSLDEKISDLKSRLDRGEGQEKGTTQQRQQNQIQSNWSIGSMITLGTALLVAGIAIAIAIINHK